MYCNTVAILAETGEVLENVNITSSDDRNRYKEYLDNKKNIETKTLRINDKYKEYGGFVWLLYNAGQVLDLGVQPEVLTKLIYISTYMKYDNRLMLSNDKSMTKHGMMDVLKVSERTFRDFYNAVTDSGILIEDKDGCLYLNTDIFRRGSIKSGTVKDVDRNRTRLYVNSIRSLYKQAKISDHRLLSYLFQAIPFVNVNYNILCFNPVESDLDMVKPMQVKDFCPLVGYSQDNDRRLKTKLKKLRLKKIPVFSFVDNASGLFCYVNPNVYYAGNQWEKVEILGKFQKEDK